jgi:hypothetical protein
MDTNDYAIGILAEQRLREARVEAARRELVARHRRPRPSLRGRIGAALIAIGQRLVAGAAHDLHGHASCIFPGH